MRRLYVRRKAVVAKSKKKMAVHRGNWKRKKVKSFKRGVRRRIPWVPAVKVQVWKQRAFAAGEHEATTVSLHDPGHIKPLVNERWGKWYHSLKPKIPPLAYAAAAGSFLEGFSRKLGFKLPDWVLVPKTKSIGAVVTVMNEEKTINGVLQQLSRLPLDETIVIVNGSSDGSFHSARSGTNAVIVHYPQPIGHDVGRAVGAKLAKSDIVLFLDGDFPILAEHLAPFLCAVENGLDVALNDITPYLQLFSSRDMVTTMKEFLNRTMGRADLGNNSLTAVPHALSRRAIEKIGYKQLMVPPKAQVIAIREGLSIGSPMSVDVISKNRVRSLNTGKANPVSEMIIGDHLEALQTAMQYQGERLSFQDTIRKRMMARGENL